MARKSKSGAPGTAKRKASAKPKAKARRKAEGEGPIVLGTITDRAGSPAADLTVVAFDDDRRGENVLGQAMTDAAGAYRIPYDESRFRRSPKERGGADVYIRVLDASAMLLLQSKTVRDAPQRLVLDARLTAADHVVRGEIRRADASPAAGLRVRVYRKDLRSEEPLADAHVSGVDGRYTIPYPAPPGRIDLVVRAFVKGEPAPAASRIVFDAPAEADVTLVIDDGEGGDDSEVGRLRARLEPALQGVPLAELREDADVQDFTFLAGRTGAERPHIELLAAANRLAVGPAFPELPPEVLYGWFRLGVAVDADEVWTHGASDLVGTYREAIARQLIPGGPPERVEAIEAAIKEGKAAAALRPAVEGRRASLGDILATLPDHEALPVEQQLTVARLAEELGYTEIFWKRAAEAGLSDALPALKRTVALADLSDGHTALVRALQARTDRERPASLEFLASLARTDWIALVFEHGPPLGGDIDRDTYIDELQARVETLVPAAVLRRELADRLGDGPGFPTAEVGGFLESHPDLDLRTRPIEPLLVEEGTEVSPTLTEALLRLTRVHALTSTARDTSIVVGAGFGSATQIAAAGRAGFGAAVGSELPSARADAIFASARRVAAAAVALGVAYAAPSTSALALRVVPAPAASAAVLRQYPSLQTLFGDLDTCECRRCQSVLGPAAYLTDLLHFLQRSLLLPDADGGLLPANAGSFLSPLLEHAANGTVLGVLLQRRPDLADLELSCENTDTKIPYIDLVLEILENAAALPLRVAAGNRDLEADLAAGIVPPEAIAALRRTDEQVGTSLHVTADPHLGTSSVLSAWIITDGSRRWLTMYLRPAFYATAGGGFAPLALADRAVTIDALEHGSLGAELEAFAAQGLSLEGAPTIQSASPTEGIRFWLAVVTRAVAIRLTMASPAGVIELLRIDGTPFAPPRQWQFPTQTLLVIGASLSSTTTGPLDPNVAALLGLPSTEPFARSFNPANGCWELRHRTLAGFADVTGALIITGLTYQSSPVREHLESSPENLNPAAYDKLSGPDALFPWSLPFDLWLEETRAFLDALGVSRASLIDLCRPRSRSTDPAAAQELLGLSPSDADLITSAGQSTQPWRYWGLVEVGNAIADRAAGETRSGSWLEVLAHLSMLLQQSGLTYREYLDLLETSFLDGSRPILFPPNRCKTSEMILAGLEAEALAAHLGRVHVLTRLWRKAGLVIHDLDQAIAAFGGELTAECLQDLSALKRLQARLEMPMSALIGCIHELGTRSWRDGAAEGRPLVPSPYDRVYQRPALRSLTGFADLAAANLGTTALHVSERAEVVAAALGVKRDQVTGWLAAAELDIDDSLTLASLSRLHAAATLSRALRLSVDALPDVVAVLGPAANPFRLPAGTPADPVSLARARTRALLELVERVAFARSSGFTVEELSYLLRHVPLPRGPVDPRPAVELRLAQQLGELRAAVQAGVVLGEPGADNLRRQLARLGWYPALLDAAVGADGVDAQLGAAVDIAPPLAPPPVVPLDLRSKVRYREVDPDLAVLECFGSLAAEDFVAIRDAQIVPAAAVTTLEGRYGADLGERVTALATLLEIMELDRLPTVSVAIAALTSVPRIPDALKGRLAFELTSATSGRLELFGWLTDAERDAVIGANPGLATELASLQSAAQQAIPAPSAQTTADAEALLRVADLDQRRRRVLLRLVPRLEADLVVDRLSVALGGESRVIAGLLAASGPGGRTALAVLTDAVFVGSPPTSRVTRLERPEQFETLERLAKIVALAGKLGVTAAALPWFIDGTFAVLDLFALPVAAASPAASFDDWRRLVDLARLRDALPDGPARVAQIHDALADAAGTPADREAAVRHVIADAYGASDAEAATACGATLLAFGPLPGSTDHRDPSRLLELAQLLRVKKLLGMSLDSVASLIQPAPAEPEARLARALFAASVPGQTLPDRLRPISNRLRIARRDALVAHLVHRDGLLDATDLFDRYLIDVEMSPCMLTSRIKQAISSVQLFVQRCLLNLERPAGPGFPGVSPDSIDPRRVQWMRYQGGWEANRRIFLFPENWLDPQTRDDRTELSRKVESDLLESELTHDSALRAFARYLEDTAEVLNLTVVSMFDEVIDEPAQTLLHLVARDNSQPYKHYYRQWRMRPGQDFGTWTAWEKIAIPLDSEHVVAFAFNGDVYLAWPTITGGASDLSWQVQMNLGRRSAAGWSKVKKSRDAVTTPMIADHDERDSFAFRMAFDIPENIALIRCHARAAPAAQVTPRAERFETSPRVPDLRTLSLRVRTMAKAVDGSGRAFHYLATDFTSWVLIEFTFRDTGAPNVVQNGVRTLPLSSLNGGTGDLRSRIGLFPTTYFAIAYTNITVTAAASGQRYVSPSFRKTRPLDQDVLWYADIVFDLQEGELPELPPDRSPEFPYVESFKLTDDETFGTFVETFTAGTHPSPLDHPADTEHFISGYRQLDGVQGLRLPDNQVALTSVAGRYFTVKAQTSRPTGRSVWAYRDERSSLLFWKGAAEPAYRVVPFSTLGMAMLRSDVARDQLTEAVGLPLETGGSLAPVPIAVGPGVDAAPGRSVTEIRIDFGPVPTSLYNWEIFFHNPLLIAVQLGRAQRFQEAQRWFHLIFDPTSSEPGTDASRFWRFPPFRNAVADDAVDVLLEELARTGGRPGLRDDIDEWATNPFRPHLVARHRLRSYQIAVVLRYVENLLAWGDQVFRRDTLEAINEATQLYVLAARILGRRPASSPRRDVFPKSYRDLYRRLDDFSNAWIPFEGFVSAAGRSAGPLSSTNDDDRGRQILDSLGGLYFCIPMNEALLEHWDTVEDRLFKIRHCMNIDGVVRQLPLFDAPIDPALLVEATAAGLDIGAVLADVQTPVPLYRFTVTFQKAVELCAEVRALGSALLGALERKDGEELAALRTTHELEALRQARAVKEAQRDEASASVVALQKARETSVQTYLNFQRLLGRQGVAVPAEGAAPPVERSSLQLAAPGPGAGDAQSLALTAAEASHLGSLNEANNFTIAAGVFNTMAGVSHSMPEVTVSYFFLSTTVGGTHVGNSMNAMGTALSTAASNSSFQATQSSIIGSHQRRYDDWRFQSNLAAKEIAHIDQQIVASKIRERIAEREIANHDQLIENSRSVSELMRDKFTSKDLYSWMVGQISNVYFRTYQLGLDLARRAERAYRFELGLADSSIVGRGYWDSLKRGLLCGEALLLDLRRLEAAFQEQNRRELEITRHVSLLQLDPVALLMLKETGSCEVQIPEAFFDMDFPGHYFRRIRSVSLTIPCVTGPFSTVPCTVTLLKHSVRCKSDAPAGYARDLDGDDRRFVDSFAGIESIVTSSAQNDAGLFDANLRDERYLPFEGAGAISTWRLELPRQFRPFAYDTISDVVMHLRYTARDGGAAFRDKVVAELAAAVNGMAEAGGEAGLARVFSMRHEFPTEWHRFMNPAPTAAGWALELDLDGDRFPLPFRGRRIAIHAVELILEIETGADPSSATGQTYLREYANSDALVLDLTPPGTGAAAEAVSLASDPGFLDGLPHGTVDIAGSAAGPARPGTFSLGITDAHIEAIHAAFRTRIEAPGGAHHRLKPDVVRDLFLVCRYSV